MKIAGYLEFEDLEVIQIFKCSNLYCEVYSAWVFQKGLEIMEENIEKMEEINERYSHK